MEHQTMQEMEEATPTEPIEPTLSAPAPEEGNNTGKIIAAVIGGLAILVLLSALLYGMVSHPILTSILRDISIIVLALVTIVTGIFLAIMLIQLQALIVLLRDEIYPLLQSINQTADTVRGTTTFVSDAVVSPMINVASYASGVRQSLRILTGSSKRKSQPQPGSSPRSTSADHTDAAKGPGSSNT
jgi:hypothetical protein